MYNNEKCTSSWAGSSLMGFGAIAAAGARFGAAWAASAACAWAEDFRALRRRSVKFNSPRAPRYFFLSLGYEFFGIAGNLPEASGFPEKEERALAPKPRTLRGGLRGLAVAHGLLLGGGLPGLLQRVEQTLPVLHPAVHLRVVAVVCPSQEMWVLFFSLFVTIASATHTGRVTLLSDFFNLRTPPQS